MRVLVTGAAGMLGADLCAALRAAGHEPVPTDLAGAPIALDITDAAAVAALMAAEAPDAVVHCAAYTNVDGAERDPDTAYRVNALGTWCVAAACAGRDVPLCAVSTDFVFGGAGEAPYTEYDRPAPLNHYGASKLAGETHVRALCRRHWVVRTAWLYGLHGKCFPGSIIDAARTRPELRVVADQRGCPTSTEDLAAAMARLLPGTLYGTYHVVNSGEATWHEFAREALRLAGIQTPVAPIAAAEWPSPTRRPANSVLRCLALEMQGQAPLRPWREALADYVARRERGA